jgi:hypothetical protein
MQPYLEKTYLQPAGAHKGTQIYELAGGKFANRYFIISNEGTRHLLASPEVIGYESYLAMCGATSDMLGWLKQNGSVGSNADIMTILRGGLNYPLEECCYRNGINVNNMDFISCERVIRNNQITGLDIRYTKLTAPKEITLMIGDIIASGETLARCIRYIIAEFKRLGGSIRRMVFFTIGGTRGIELFEELTNEFRFHWPEFEGITCIFYEGIFSAYQDKGVTGISWPQIDFFWKDGVISPDFRRYVLSDDDALFEKCIIYDGGARRYEIPDHYHEVTEYWENIREVADNFTFKDFLDEKLGYPTPISFEKWLELNHYQKLDQKEMTELYTFEREFASRSEDLSIIRIADRRLNEFKAALKKYCPTIE